MMLHLLDYVCYEHVGYFDDCANVLVGILECVLEVALGLADFPTILCVNDVLTGGYQTTYSWIAHGPSKIHSGNWCQTLHLTL